MSFEYDIRCKAIALDNNSRVGSFVLLNGIPQFMTVFVETDTIDSRRMVNVDSSLVELTWHKREKSFSFWNVEPRPNLPELIPPLPLLIPVGEDDMHGPVLHLDFVRHRPWRGSSTASYPPGTPLLTCHRKLWGIVDANNDACSLANAISGPFINVIFFVDRSQANVIGT